jgi:hypothetical protein
LTYLIRLTKNSLSVYGDFHSYKHFVTDCVDERICMSRYITFNENHPVFWRFIFYQGNKGWILLQI